MLKYESNFQWSICFNKNEIPRYESNILVEMKFSRQSSRRSNKFVLMRKWCVEWRRKSLASKEAEELQLPDCVFIERQRRSRIHFSQRLACGKAETRAISFPARSQDRVLPKRNRKFPFAVKWPLQLHKFRNYDSKLFNQTRWTRTCLHVTSLAEKRSTSMKIALETLSSVLSRCIYRVL